jgi:hypothetical protein
MTALNTSPARRAIDRRARHPEHEQRQQEVHMKYGVARFVLPALVASVGALLVPQSGLAQNDPLVGVWKANLAKSKYPPDQVPIAYRIIQPSGQGLIQAFGGADAKGASFLVVNTLICDGQQHPTVGSGGSGANTCRRPDPYTREFVNFQNGKQTGAGTQVVSRDGSTMTVTFATGNVAVYDRIGPGAPN